MPVDHVVAPGARVVIRDEEWLVKSCAPLAHLDLEAKSNHPDFAVKVVGLSELVRGHCATFLTTLDDIVEMRPEETELVADDSPQYRRSRLYLESLLRKTPPTDDKIYIGHRGAVNAANYQLTPAAMALAALRPSILIADGVGIGKTIEVGILVSELVKRGRGDRILVVALKSLLGQFQQELWARYAIPLVRLDSVGLQRVRQVIPANKNPFYYYNRAIISIDTLKNDGRYRTFLENCRWDIIVIDECHHVANADTKRNRLASLLARTTDTLILTSATPHNGRPENFANLMNMLEPTAIANPQDYTKDEIKGLFVRRFKKDIEHEVSEHFRERETIKRPVRATDAEERVLSHIRDLRFHTLNRRSKRHRRDVLFNTTLFKAFLSSPAACLDTVRARLKSIEKKLEESNRKDRSMLDNDKTVLEMLEAELQSVVSQPFSKLDALADRLKEIGWTGRGSCPRVIIFSERKRTLALIEEFLKERLKAPSKAIAVFHAGLSDREQMQVVEDFGREDSPLRALLATDVASEGVNLHFYCNNVIHFDIPWSFITIEQRNGRIDRYGQEKTPYIAYLLTVSQDESVKADLRILERLIEKEEAAHKNIGDVATLLGLHDAILEEEYFECGISAGESAKDLIPDEVSVPDFLSLFTDETAVPDLPADCIGEQTSLFEDDIDFARSAFDEIYEGESKALLPDFHPDKPAFTLIAPDDLKKTCSFLPREAIPKGWEFILTTDRSRVQKAIDKARQLAKEGEATWPREQLFWELHPVMQWLIDKVVCRFQRHEAPVIVASKLGGNTARFLFQGILSNRRSQPVLVEWFTVDLSASGKMKIGTLDSLLADTGFDKKIANMGKASSMFGRLVNLRDRAVRQAEKHVNQLRARRREDLGKRVAHDRSRFERWYERSKRQVNDYLKSRRTKGGDAPRIVREKARRLLHNIEQTKRQRELWLDLTLELVETPYIRLAAVFTGK